MEIGIYKEPLVGKPLGGTGADSNTRRFASIDVVPAAQAGSTVYCAANPMNKRQSTGMKRSGIPVKFIDVLYRGSIGNDKLVSQIHFVALQKLSIPRGPVTICQILRQLPHCSGYDVRGELGQR